MNWLAIVSLVAGLLKTLAGISRQWLDRREKTALDTLRARGNAYDRLAKAAKARNRMASDGSNDTGGLQNDRPDRWRRD